MIACEKQLAANPMLPEGHCLRFIRRSWGKKRPSVDRTAGAWIPHSPEPDPSCVEAHGKPKRTREVTTATHCHPLTTTTFGKAATELDPPAHVAGPWSGRFSELGPIRPCQINRSCTRCAPMRCCDPTLPTSKPRPLVPIQGTPSHRQPTSSLAAKKGNVVSTHVAAYGLSSVRASCLEAI